MSRFPQTATVVLVVLAQTWTSGVSAFQDHAEDDAAVKDGENTRLVQSFTNPKYFHGMNCMDVSPDGQFLYASAWRSNSVSIFEMEGMSGRLELVDHFTDEDMTGNSSIRISPDGRWGAVAVGIGKRVLLLERSAEDGRLSLVDQHEATTDTTGNRMFNDAVFSPNSRFLAVGGMRSSEDGAGALSIFQVDHERKELKWLQTVAGPGGCLVDVRSLEFSEDGKTLVAAAVLDSSLVVCDFDATTGEVKVRQVLQDNDEISCLEYVFGVRISPDAKFVYTTSGRLQRTFGMGVFRFGEGGHLELVQQLTGQEDGLEGVLGGNELEISHDGKYVVTTLTDSQEVAVFERNPNDGMLTLWRRIQDPDDELFSPAGLTIGRDYDTRIIFSSEDSKRLLVHEILDK